MRRFNLSRRTDPGVRTLCGELKELRTLPQVVQAMKLIRPQDLRMQAAKCRRLARGTDPRTETALLELAENYEAEAAELERGDADAG